jgi:ABC-2 type transport system permease protein
MMSGQKSLDATIDQLQRDRDRKVESIEREKEHNIRLVQTRYKIWTLLLPPIFPLVVAFGVFLYRRGRETEGVARSRLR